MRLPFADSCRQDSSADTVHSGMRAYSGSAPRGMGPMISDPAPDPDGSIENAPCIRSIKWEGPIASRGLQAHEQKTDSAIDVDWHDSNP